MPGRVSDHFTHEELRELARKLDRVAEILTNRGNEAEAESCRNGARTASYLGLIVAAETTSPSGRCEARGG